MLTVDTVCTVVEVRGEIAIARNYFVGYCYSELSVQTVRHTKARGWACGYYFARKSVLTASSNNDAPRRQLEQPSQIPPHVHFSAHSFTFRSHQFSHPATIQNREVCLLPLAPSIQHNSLHSPANFPVLVEAVVAAGHSGQPSQIPSHVHLFLHVLPLRAHHFSHPATIQHRSMLPIVALVQHDSLH